MNAKSSLPRGVGIFLVLAVLLPVGQAPPVTALEARQELSPRWVVQGYGDFPRLPIVASGADGSTLTLYLVEGDRATRLVEFDGLNVGSDSVIARLSPDGEHVAILLLDSWDGASTLEVVNVEDSGRLTLDQGRGDLTPERGAAHETISGLAWLDDRHILYSKTISPGAEETDGSQLRGEIWLTNLTGAERRRLAEAPIYRVLGASPDGEWVYCICDPQQEGYLGDGFCALDLASGAIRLLWPRADLSMQGSSSANGAFFGFRLVTMPDGTQRVAFVGSDARSVARSEPPDVWLGDPESGEARIIWTVSQGETFADGWSVYDVPVDFLWSPRSEFEFAYLGDGAAFGGGWRVDVENQQISQLIAGNVGLVSWAEEGDRSPEPGSRMALGRSGGSAWGDTFLRRDRTCTIVSCERRRELGCALRTSEVGHAQLVGQSRLVGWKLGLRPHQCGDGAGVLSAAAAAPDHDHQTRIAHSHQRLWLVRAYRFLYSRSLWVHTHLRL